MTNEAVFELDGGTFDISAAPPPPLKYEQEKTDGNAAFVRGDYDQAASHYSKAIKECTLSGDAQFLSICFSNLAACKNKLGDYQVAVEDAKEAIKLDSTNFKAHFRLASNLLLVKTYKEALSACDKGLAIENDNKAMLNLKVKIQRAKAADKTTKPSSSADKSKSFGVLYSDKTEKYGSSREMLRQLKSELSSGKAGKTHSHLNGMFLRLMNAENFQKTIFPGLSKDAR